ncbi:MAG: Tnp 1-associated [Pseudomonadota bacterium]
MAEFLDMTGGVPSHDTIGRVFAALNPKALGEAFRRWTLSLVGIPTDLITRSAVIRSPIPLIRSLIGAQRRSG